MDSYDLAKSVRVFSRFQINAQIKAQHVVNSCGIECAQSSKLLSPHRSGAHTMQSILCLCDVDASYCCCHPPSPPSRLQFSTMLQAPPSE